MKFLIIAVLALLGPVAAYAQVPPPLAATAVSPLNPQIIIPYRYEQCLGSADCVAVEDPCRDVWYGINRQSVETVLASLKQFYGPAPCQHLVYFQPFVTCVLNTCSIITEGERQDKQEPKHKKN